jgi:hypothetical protein
MSDQLMRVEEYNLADFLRKIQELVRLGYEVDYESNYGYPKHYMTSYSCSMLKVPAVESKEPEVVLSPVITSRRKSA